MSAFISKQPNGLYCRFSNVVDCLTHINLTYDEYIQLCVNKWGESARADAIDVLENYTHDFSEVLSKFIPNNISINEFREQLKEIEYDGEYRY